jgi:hypothetical protein
MVACSSCVKQLKSDDSELNSINRTEGYSMPNIRTCFCPTSYAPFAVLLVLKGTTVCASGSSCHLNVLIFLLVCASRLSWFHIWLRSKITKSDNYLPYVCVSVCQSVYLFAWTRRLHCTNFHEIWNLRISRISFWDFQVLLKSDKKNQCVTVRHVHTHDNTLLNSSETRNAVDR